MPKASYVVELINNRELARAFSRALAAAQTGLWAIVPEIAPAAQEICFEMKAPGTRVFRLLSPPNTKDER